MNGPRTLIRGGLLGLLAMPLAACLQGNTERQPLSPRFEQAAQWPDKPATAKAGSRPSFGRLALAMELADEVGQKSDRPEDAAFSEALHKRRPVPVSKVPAAAWSSLALLFDAIELGQSVPPGRCDQLVPAELAAIPRLLATARAPTDAASLRAQLWYALELAQARPSGAHLQVTLDIMKGALETARDEHLCLWKDAAERPPMPSNIPLMAYAREVRCSTQMLASELGKVEGNPAKSITTAMLNDYIAYHERVIDRLESKPGDLAAIFAELANPTEAPELVKLMAPTYFGHLLELATQVEQLAERVTCHDPPYEGEPESLRKTLIEVYGDEVSTERYFNMAIAPSSLGGVRIFGLNRGHALGNQLLATGDRVLAINDRPIETRAAMLAAMRTVSPHGVVVSLIRGGERREVRLLEVPSQDAKPSELPSIPIDEPTDSDDAFDAETPPSYDPRGEPTGVAWVRRTGEYDFTLEAGPLREAWREGLDKRDARFVPHYKDNQYQGFKLVGVRPGSVYRVLGLRSGDVIVGIDGEALSAPDKAQLFVDRFGQATGPLTVDIERRGQPRRLSYTIITAP